LEQNSIKFGSFYFKIKFILVQTVLWTSTSKYRWKFVYRPIFKRTTVGR